MFAQLLKSTLEKMPMPEPAMPSGRSVYLPTNDIDTNEHSEPIADNISSALYISYKNSKGEISNRRISVKTVGRAENGNIMIGAYCYERKAFRTFRADRIVEAVDLGTGEVIDKEDGILDCFGLSGKSHTSDPAAETKEALRNCGHALNVLVYLARCDGQFHHEEENVVIHYLMDRCFECKFDDEYLLTRIRRHFQVKWPKEKSICLFPKRWNQTWTLIVSLIMIITTVSVG